MTWPLSEVKSCLQSARSCLSEIFFSAGISARAVVRHLLKFGGSLGTITGWPGLWEACSLAATYIQWSTALRLIGLPPTVATAPSGTPLEPHPLMTSAMSTKKAPSAGINLLLFMGLRRW